MKNRLLDAVLAVLICCLPSFAEPAQPTAEPAKTVDELMRGFSHAEHFWQQEGIARELIARGDATVIPRIERYLETQDRRRRCNAALVLAGLGDRRGVSILIGELKDKTPRPTDMKQSDGSPDFDGQVEADRYYAAVLLGQLGNKEAVPALIEATRDKSIDYQAAISLGRIGDKSAIPALREMIETNPRHRLWAGFGLAALGESEGFDILTEVIRSDPAWVQRRHAVTALGQIGQARALPILMVALKDEHVSVRVSAAHALGQIGDPAALAALTEALGDTEVTKVNAPTTLEQEARKAIEAIKARTTHDVR